MLKSIPFANAATVITAVFYIACALLSYLAPDLIFTIGNSWVHSLNLEAIKAASGLSFGSLVFGLVSISVITWITAYALIELYNRFAHR